MAQGNYKCDVWSALASENTARAVADSRWRRCLITATRNTTLSLYLDAIEPFLLYADSRAIAGACCFRYRAIDTSCSGFLLARFGELGTSYPELITHPLYSVTQLAVVRASGSLEQGMKWSGFS
jgi:hypothetical protein